MKNIIKFTICISEGIYIYIYKKFYSKITLMKDFKYIFYKTY